MVILENILIRDAPHNSAYNSLQMFGEFMPYIQAIFKNTNLKKSVLCLKSTFLEIPYKEIWVSWGVVLEGLGVIFFFLGGGGGPNDTQWPSLE